ncbi:MAG: DUF1961 family protein [Verrucomicrobiota bacterium]
MRVLRFSLIGKREGVLSILISSSLVFLGCGLDEADSALLDGKELKLIYSNDFEEEADLEHWVIEGPGSATIEEGRLRLQSNYAVETQDYLARGGNQVSEFVESLMIEDVGEDRIKDYYLRGSFRDAHFVFWNKFPTPENYVLECEFQSVSKYPLHMIMFSHLGLKGESVFDSSLKPRTGVSAQYTNSDLKGYRVSYFHPERETTNLRKSPEKEILATGPDATDQSPLDTHHLRIIKVGNRVVWQINGEESFSYVEEDPTKALEGGYFAFRLMNPAMGIYDNLRVYKVVGDF